ncbi:MAG: DNA polymerase III subunit beta [Planctomycetes bacterium ADurb.Bin126]|nr:MAG: DNA polymerase III subunit beta [Planctomycetes bacterium ADurb.Bin126]HOD80200.1 DNA polymerase III subunit beta [Phycisphaerae bacterium]HQL71672.1 DNA polymerase III subunit beta [Phycisphaerae bacterium]
MKVIAQTAALQEALTLVGSIVVSRTPKPVLQCVKLVAADNVLTLMATDLEAGARYQVTAVQIEQEGEALVPADRLNGIVRESSDEESLTIQTEKDSIMVRGSGSRFKVFGYDPSEYPAVADFAQDADFQVASATLSEMIGKTLFATAKAHSHYAISGVLWEASGKKLQLVATDGHRLAMAKGSLPKAAGRDVRAIVPAKLMSLIQRVCGSAEETLDVKIEENQVLVRTSRAVLVSSLVQGNFPKYGDVIPKEANRKAAIDTGRFEHRIRQAALLTNEESRGVRLSFQGDQVTLSSRAPEAGEAEVTCPITLEGEPVDIAFNPVFLLDALRVAGTDQISFEMNAGNKPAMIRAGNDFVYVLMPVDLG